MSKVRTITNLHKPKPRAIIVKLKKKNTNTSAKTRRIKYKFSWDGLEKERQELIEAATLLRQCSSECGYDDNTFFARAVTAFHKGSDHSIDDTMGKCLRTIRKLQYELVHNHHLNWNFVYKEWSVISNPNQFQQNLTSSLLDKDIQDSITEDIDSLYLSHNE